MLNCIGYFDFLKKYLNSSNVLKRPQRFSFQIPKPGHFSSSLAGHNVPRKASHYSHNSATGKMQSAIRNFLVKITDFFCSSSIFFSRKPNRIIDLLHIYKIWKITCLSIYTNNCFDATMNDPKLWSRVNNSWCHDTVLGLIGWFRCGINLVIITN